MKDTQNIYIHPKYGIFQYFMNSYGSDDWLQLSFASPPNWYYNNKIIEHDISIIKNIDLFRYYQNNDTTYLFEFENKNDILPSRYYKFLNNAWEQGEWKDYNSNGYGSEWLFADINNENISKDFNIEQFVNNSLPLSSIEMPKEKNICHKVTIDESSNVNIEYNIPFSPIETRMDNDGNYYTKLEFENYYGGTYEWNICEPSKNAKRNMIEYFMKYYSDLEPDIFEIALENILKTLD